MLTGIDHVVVAVRSVEAAAAVLERELGIAFTGGGRHDAWGTWNRLAFFGDTYLELIGVFDADLVRSAEGNAVSRATLDRLDAGEEGLVTYAVATDAIAKDVGRLRDEGSAIGLPVAGSRTRPDGEVVRWWTAVPPSLGPDRPPFLIEHELVGAEWGAAARAARSTFGHPDGGAIRLATLELPVGDPGAVADRYGRDVGIAFSEGWRVAVGGQCVVLRPDGESATVELTAWPGSAPLDVLLFGVRWRRVADVEP